MAAGSQELESRSGDVLLTPGELRWISVFRSLSTSAEKRLKHTPGHHALVLRHYRAGEVVCREGEPGNTAFYILRDKDLAQLRAAQGTGQKAVTGKASSVVEVFMGGGDDREERKVKARVSLSSQRRPATSNGKSKLVGQVARLLSIGTSRPVPVDAPVTLADDGAGKLVAYLHEGELFGEMSCMNGTPRSATVTIEDDCYVLELLRNVFEVLIENQEFKDALAVIYRKRVLADQLRSLSIFAAAPETAIDQLKQRASLISLEPGQFLFQKDDPADAMFVVRLGAVKLTDPDGRVTAYCSRGEPIGIGSFLGAEVHHESASAYEQGSRVEVVAIDRALFEEVKKSYPEVELAARIAEEQHRRSREAVPFKHLAAKMGLMEAEKLLVIDLDTCTRCNDCVTACASVHDDGLPRLALQGPRLGDSLIARSCRQCRDPICLVGCPVGSIHRGRTGEIVIEDWCIGCGVCAQQCPYDAIHTAELTAGRRAIVCDQCGSIGGEPMCLYSCGTGSARRVDGGELFDSG